MKGWERMGHLLNEEILPDFAIEYLESLIKKDRKPSTIKRYTYDLEDFFRWLHTEKRGIDYSIFSSLTKKDLETFFSLMIEKRNYTQQTMQRIMTVLNQLYKFLQKKGLPIENPMQQLPYKTGQLKTLTKQDFISENEQKCLYETMNSFKHLTEHQKKARPKLRSRNMSILILFLEYGMTLQELVSLKMNNIHFESNTIDLHETTNVPRTIRLTMEHKKVLYDYYQTIPEPVRPRYHSHDPFFIAFDFQRGTFRWVYEIDAPKKLTEISVQKMIRQEVKRAGLRKGISHQHMRNTAVLRAFQNGESLPSIQRKFGFKTPLSLKRIQDYYDALLIKRPPSS